jgi:hypothetical protein
MLVPVDSTKSSADSISAPVPGRVAVAIKPSGLPVLKKNGVDAAAAGRTLARQSMVVASKAALAVNFIFVPLGLTRPTPSE